jgi:hypothetical protein
MLDSVACVTQVRRSRAVVIGASVDFGGEHGRLVCMISGFGVVTGLDVVAADRHPGDEGNEDRDTALRWPSPKFKPVMFWGLEIQSDSEAPSGRVVM